MFQRGISTDWDHLEAHIVRVKFPYDLKAGRRKHRPRHNDYAIVQGPPPGHQIDITAVFGPWMNTSGFSPPCPGAQVELLDDKGGVSAC